MGLRQVDLHSVLQNIIDMFKRDYLESSSDYFTQIRSVVFDNYYAVKPLLSTKTNSAKSFLFIDAGFKIYELDVAIIIPIQMSGLLRNENGELVSIDKLLDKPVVDTLVIYASRKRVSNGYSFTLTINCLTNETVLFDSKNTCVEVSNELNSLISGMISYRRFRTPRFFTKFAKYIEGLIEIAYGLKLRRSLHETHGYEPVVVYDGTLLRWFSIRRKGFNIDGLDIISKILETKVSSLETELVNVIGLSKTTKFTTIARSYSLFRTRGETSVNTRGLYTEVNINNLSIVREILTEVLNKFSARDYVDETIKLFNRIVYDKNKIYVARFPLTSDYNNVFIVDLYTSSEIVTLSDSNNVEINYTEASSVNERLSSIIPSLYTYRSKLVGEPPLGYMEVDGFVRYSKELSSIFEEALLITLSSVDEPFLKPLVQAFSSTLRMRYGYS